MEDGAVAERFGANGFSRIAFKTWPKDKFATLSNSRKAVARKAKLR